MFKNLIKVNNVQGLKKYRLIESFSMIPNKLLRVLFVLSIGALVIPALKAADLSKSKMLPTKTTPIPVTTTGIPHMQIDIRPIPELSKLLLQKVATIPNVEIRETVMSISGAKGFWVKEQLPLVNPDAIIRGREFAHLHPDGSLHASLPPELAQRAVNAGWAIHHPWSTRKESWKGFVMIYTPKSKSELDVVLQLVLASYNFVTGEKALYPNN